MDFTVPSQIYNWLVGADPLHGFKAENRKQNSKLNEVIFYSI